MKIAIIGAGAIGSIVAGFLEKTGQSVTLVAKKEQSDTIQRNGLRIKSADGEEVVRLKNVVTKLDPKSDLVIFTVKTQAREMAYQDNHQFLEEECLIMTTQNGVQADNLLSSHFELRAMISSIVMFGATYIQPGEVVYNFPGNWIIGKPFTPVDENVQKVKEIFGKAFSVVVVPNIMGMKWLKLFVNFNNCIPALIGKSMQETFSDMDFCRLSIILLKEGVELVRTVGIEMISLPNFPVDRVMGLTSMPTEQGAAIINKTLTTLSNEPLYGSILQSIKRGKPSEIDFINGEVTHLAKSIGKSSPLNRKVVDLVHQVEQRGAFFDPEEIKKEFKLT